MGQVRHRRLQRSTVAGQLPCVDLQQGLGRQQIPAGGQALQLAHGEALQLPGKVRLRQGCFCHGAAQDAALHGGGDVRLQLAQPALQGLCCAPALADAHQTLLGQIVHGRHHLRVYRCQKPVAAVGDDALTQQISIRQQLPGHGLILHPSRQRLQPFGGLLRRTVPPQRKYLAGRQQQRLPTVLRPPLGGDVEEAQRVHLVVKKFASHRGLGAGGVDVQNTAPQGELSRPLHLLRAGIARRRQPPGQLLHLIPPVRAEGEAAPIQHLRGNASQGQCIGGGNDHRGLLLPDAVQGLQPPVFPLTAHRRQLPPVELPARQQDRLPAGEGPQVRRLPPGLPLVGAEHQQGTPGLQPQRCRRHGPVYRAQARHQCRSAAALHQLRQLLYLPELPQLPQQSFHPAASFR